MRVMLDTNVLISALLFPSRHMDLLFEKVVTEHTMVLSSYVIDELHKVIERKFPTKVQIIEKLLDNMSYELVYTPRFIEEKIVDIRDISDYPVIYTAIKEEVDVLITGDKDYFDLQIERPKILTPREYLELF